ncbi:MAG: mechanosensitive ion channel family protein [Gemmatimonadetes bacterium]|nr:mechanosensitive ion channel family protein [Gemmatimonadota bacterium]
MNNPLVDQLLSGSGPIYMALAAVALLALVLRSLSEDPNVGRRALFVVGLIALFAVIQAVLAEVPMITSGLVRTPTGELVPGLVEHPLRQYLGVTLLLVGLLAALLAVTLVFVDFLLVDRLDVEIPNILRDVTIVVLFFAGSLIVLNERTDLNTTSLFTTAGVVSIVIGLALQDTLGNVFSGLALQTERSFNVGDWVRFGDREGVVMDISWRATKLRTRSNDLVIIPNSVISKDVLVNFSTPSRVHAEIARVGASYRHPPADVIAALEEAADQTPGILKAPRPDVRTTEYGDFAILYEIKYWIRDYAELEEIADSYMTRVWYSFDRRGIEIPFPIRNVYMREVTPEVERAEAEADDERIFEHLRRAPLFDALSDEEARALAARVRVERFYEGETLVRQGRPGDSMYIIDVGRVEVVVSSDGRSERIAELGPTGFIGEMALMTGADRTATVVALEPVHCFVIDRDALRETLEANPTIAEEMSETLAERQAELERTRAALDEAARATGEDKHQILSRIRAFFFGGSESS